MATPAVRPKRGLFAALAELSRPGPTQLELCLRVALICTLTTLVVEIYRTPSAALAAYVVFFMNRPDRVTSVIANVALVLLLSTVVGIVFGASLLVLDDAMWRVLAIALLSFVFTFLTSASKLRPVGPIMALFTGYALDLIGARQSGETVTRALLYICLFGATAGGVSVVVNLLIAPAPRRLAEHAIARCLNVAADVLRAPDAGAPRALAQARARNPEVLKWIHLAGIEKTSAPERLAALREAAGATVSLFAALEVMLAQPSALLPAAVREALARLCDELASDFWRGQQPRNVGFSDVLEAQPPTALGVALLGEFKRNLRDFAEPPTAEPTLPVAPAAAAAKSGFFLADAFTNPDHVRFALRTTGAALFCYLLYSLLDWPGIHTCFITVYVVSLGSVAESIEKLTLRILGCLAGAAVGVAAIVFVIPSLSSIGHLMILVFAGSLLAGYAGAGGPRVAYGGYQAGFAFFVCLLEGSGPSYDLVKVRDRIIGILLGNVVAYVAMTSFWPVSIANRIDPAIVRLLAGLNALSNATGLGKRRLLAAKLDADLQAVKTDLSVAFYEPTALRPSPAWLDAREAGLDALASLKSSLLLAPDNDGARARRALGLEALAQHFSTHAPATSSVELSAAGSAAEPLDAIVDAELERAARTLERLLKSREGAALVELA